MAEKRTFWFRIGVASAIALITLAIVVEVAVSRAGPILKGRIVETLNTQFQSRVELDNLQVSVFRGLEIEGSGLRIYAPDNMTAASGGAPILALAHFSFHSGIVGLLFKPMHVREVRATGLEIKIPPRDSANQTTPPNRRSNGKIKIVVDAIICDDSRLIVGIGKPDKDPRDFELKHIVLRNVGPNKPWDYEAALTNAIPRGEIQAQGTFGPWQIESPGDSTVTGHYTFNNADLSTIKGIGGILASVGDFKGKLDRIEINGTSKTPDFRLDVANHPVPLETKFHVIVDGMTGDTYLQPIEARLGGSQFTTSGSVINVKGKGHRIDLDLDVADCRLADFLTLAVKTTPPVITASVTTKSKLNIQAGKGNIVERLGLEGAFTLTNIHFSNADVQDKVDMLSQRALGKPQDAKPGAAEVAARIQGKFTLNGGVLQFGNLHYEMPGAEVNLAGDYSLDGQTFELHGRVLTRANISQMVEARWKSFLLEPASLLFKRKGGGSSIPVAISGTSGKPKFGIELPWRHDDQKAEK